MARRTPGNLPGRSDYFPDRSFRDATGRFAPNLRQLAEQCSAVSREDVEDLTARMVGRTEFRSAYTRCGLSGSTGRAEEPGRAGGVHLGTGGRPQRVLVLLHDLC